MIKENLSTLKIHKLSQAQYDRELEACNIDENALYLTPDEVVDYIVEQGVSGIWTYRKWNSGLAECWFNGTFSEDSCTEEFGGLYITPTGDNLIYPFKFLEAPIVSVMAYGTNDSHCFSILMGFGSTLYTPSIHFVSNVNGKTNIQYSASVMGKWK